MEAIWRSCGDNKNGLLRIEYSLLGCLLVDTVKRRGDTEKYPARKRRFPFWAGTAFCAMTQTSWPRLMASAARRGGRKFATGGFGSDTSYSSDPENPPFSVQQNGQFLFVSNDTEGSDRVVEAHPFG